MLATNFELPQLFASLFPPFFFFFFGFTLQELFHTLQFQPLVGQNSNFTLFVSIKSGITFWQHCHSQPVAPPVVTQAELRPKSPLLPHHNHFQMELPNTVVHCKGVPNPSAGPHGAK